MFDWRVNNDLYMACISAFSIYREIFQYNSCDWNDITYPLPRWKCKYSTRCEHEGHDNFTIKIRFVSLLTSISKKEKKNQVHSSDRSILDIETVLSQWVYLIFAFARDHADLPMSWRLDILNQDAQQSWPTKQMQR